MAGDIARSFSYDLLIFGVKKVADIFSITDLNHKY